jgi:DNA-binding transcriptional LysR family regulator
MIHVVNLTNVDLNLFMVLDALLREGNATRAAEGLHVTQPAVSNALARLRFVLRDPLLVRNRRGLAATPRAQAIAPKLREALAGLEAIVSERIAFDPASTNRRFTLAGTDLIALSIGPRLSELLRARAPHASLHIVTVEHLAETDGLAHDIDVHLGIPPVVPPACTAEHAYYEDFVVIARRGNRRIGKRLTLERFAELPHIEAALFGRPDTRVDRALAKHGRARNVVTSVPQFASVPMFVAQSDAVATVARRVANVFAPLLPITLHKPPLALERLQIKLVWHARTDEDPGARFFRELVREAVKNVAPRAKG